MDQILSGLTGVQCYLDDLIITGPGKQSHLWNLDATLQQLEKYCLKVQEDKCDYFQPSFEYLGHVVESTSLHQAPSKVNSIMEAPSPENVSQLRSLLGLLTSYYKFMPNLANNLKPLYEVLDKTMSWKWRQM